MCHILFGKENSIKFTKQNNGLTLIEFKEFKDSLAELYKEYRELENKIDEDEQKYLHMLIDIRRSLWT